MVSFSELYVMRCYVFMILLAAPGFTQVYMLQLMAGFLFFYLLQVFGSPRLAFQIFLFLRGVTEFSVFNNRFVFTHCLRFLSIGEYLWVASFVGCISVALVVLCVFRFFSVAFGPF